ncbi:motility protein A [Alkaliphilus oremlandii]|uniref:MotA/TolQ/ExbB proton channel n=1 Tax=Alkaliphilus oremlandii (strain OhILAs) TaxID=350688 RepID=A8MHE7_ALKOO|nr:MotA/TolQ/ExbB proton channel family protein [Alkaliphilus oremlandii]ABW19034.1 MotA/TolQ/ExbB proton channel [Alkaliphilus oremlandii OhILAs]
MDLATILGIFIGMFFVIQGITQEGSIWNFIDMSSIYITFGGMIAATLVGFPLQNVLAAFKIGGKAFFNKADDPKAIIAQINTLANIARKEGLLALEEASGQIDEPFLKKGAMLIVDGTDPELVRNLLETELSFIEERHRNGQAIFEALGANAPAFGMVGTLIGLVNMLKKLDDPSAIGPSMAVALITTFYGSLFANLIFLPMATKLKLKSREEILRKEIMVEGLLSIQAGENPRIIEEKLKAFLPPKERENYNSKQEGVSA